MIEIARADVVLVAFPFLSGGAAHHKRRPAVVVQSDRYNRARAAVVLAAITSTRAHRERPCKVVVGQHDAAGREAGLRLDSVVDCQTLMTIPREQIVARLGRFPAETMRRIDNALRNALGLD